MKILPERNLVKIKNEEFKSFGKKCWVGYRTECDMFLDLLPYLLEKDELLEDSRFSL